MTAFNIVKFKIKPGMERAFLDAHRNAAADWTGMRHANIIQTGEGRFCIIGEWESMEAMAAARPQMIATLDSFGPPQRADGRWDGHVFNLGHGISQHTPPDHVAALVAAVHAHSRRLRA